MVKIDATEDKTQYLEIWCRCSVGQDPKMLDSKNFHNATLVSFNLKVLV